MTLMEIHCFFNFATMKYIFVCMLQFNVFASLHRQQSEWSKQRIFQYLLFILFCELLLVSYWRIADADEYHATIIVMLYRAWKKVSTFWQMANGSCTHYIVVKIPTRQSPPDDIQEEEEECSSARCHFILILSKFLQLMSRVNKVKIYFRMNTLSHAHTQWAFEWDAATIITTRRIKYGCCIVNIERIQIPSLLYTE